MIEDYQFGMMTIRGRKHTRDLKVVDGQVVEAWWRKEGHSVCGEDVADVLGAKPEVFVVGTGQPGLMQVTPELRSILTEVHIDLVEEPTAHAVSTFNALLRKGKRVAGAFHLTC